MQARKINIIGKSNGVGLARDLKLLADSLQHRGHEVSVRTIDKVQAGRRRAVWAQWAVRADLAWKSATNASLAADTDVNLMLEHVWPQFLSAARLNVAVPNPEWFDRHDLRFLSNVDCIWAKTVQTREIFEVLGRPTSLIGFDSEDRHLGCVPRERTFFHLAGKSMMKGTDRLLRVWARNAHWPRLIVVQHNRGDHAPEVDAANIERHIGYLDDAQLRFLQNASMFHVCLSLTEGWGHYIVEALSVGAVPLTLDAPPMNELVTAERGLLVPYESTGRQRLATTYVFDGRALEAIVERALAMSDGEWTRLSTSARNWFVVNRSGFADRIESALRELQRTRAAR